MRLIRKGCYQMVKEINEVQKLQFELMKKATFNLFNGSKVVADLEEHKDLWQGAIMKRDDLIPLRDISDNYWNIDTLYILVEAGKEKALERLVKKWDADEVSWLNSENAHGLLGVGNNEDYSKKVLSIWWD